MTISRRTLIRQLMLGAGAAALLPSCVFDKKEKSTEEGTLLLSPEQNTLLAEIADTILPKTATPGAKELGVAEFITIMVTDCFDKESQDKFMKGLKAVDELAEKRFNDPFVSLTTEQRNQLFADISGKKKDLPAEVADFFPLAKGLTIHGYMTSQYILTEVNPYQLVPGPSKGCVAINS